MNKWHIAVPAALAVLGGWLALRSCAPSEPPVATVPSVPAREVFHASKPLRVMVAATSGNHQWLERELRYVLARGKMRVASHGATDPKAFVLRVELPEGANSASARISLLAPDGVVERQIDAPLELQDRLTTVQSLTRDLPKFLGAAATTTATTTEWGTLLGTSDTQAYEAFLLAASVLLDSSGQGFTQPAHTRELARNVEQLETLARKHPQFARAQGLLAIAYLALGGEDQSSLTQIADTTAKRALTLDAELADAHSAMGLARLRHGEWVAAKERFDAALAIDVDALPALEGLACLLAEAGQMMAALPIAEHAIALQPGNIGARECLVYARIAGSGATPGPTQAAADSKNLPVARIDALSALLSGDLPVAERTLVNAAGANGDAWIKPLLRAVTDRAVVPEALRAITRAADDGEIDAATEVLCGAALRRSDFVFNRMSRLQKQNEAVPLRILWLPQTAFLRSHRRFEQIVTAVDLGSYWQEHGRPDVCEKEPQVYGCALRAAPVKTAAKRKVPEP